MNNLYNKVKRFVLEKVFFISWGKYWKDAYIHFIPKYCVRIYLFGIDYHKKSL